MRVWLAMFGCGLSATALAAPGRIVQIERPRAATIPRMCLILTETSAFCVGQTEVNDTVSVVDQQKGFLAELRVEEVKEDKTLGVCPTSPVQVYRVTARVVSGNGKDIGRGQSVGLRGIHLDERAKVLQNQQTPSGMADEMVQLALDTDGDQAPDLMITQYSCDHSSLSNGSKICFDTYMRPRGSAKLARVHQDMLERCN